MNVKSTRHAFALVWFVACGSWLYFVHLSFDRWAFSYVPQEIIGNRTYDSRTHDEKSNEPQAIVILTYQRCGSTFLGQLFNLNEKAFYVFEPLDGLYSYLYGTTAGWNVPSDIVTYNNGLRRLLPTYENAAVSNFLFNLLSCNITQLPMNFLTHVYFGYFRSTMTSLSSHWSCLGRMQATHALNKCFKLLNRTGVCPTFSRACYNALHDLDNPKLFLFNRCVADIRKRIDRECVPKMESTCSAHPLRVTKVVRASMQSMKQFLCDLPNSKVIHLIRDPRAVTLSRYRFHPSSRSKYSRAVHNKSEQLIREASIYCRQVVVDVLWRRELEREFPGRLHSVTYEQLLADPQGRATDIYRFIGETTLPMSVVYNFTKLAKSGGKLNITATELASNGRTQLTQFELDEINEQCVDMLEVFPEYYSASV